MENIFKKIMSQKRFKSERRNIFTEEINKISFSYAIKLQSIDSKETDACGRTNYLTRKKEERRN